MSIIYHHTNVHGLIGILKSKKLWATNINFLNDYNEYKIGIDTLNSICQKFINLKHDKKHDDIEKFYKDFLKTTNEMMKVNLNQRNHYIVSFTNSRDNLRQWMSYGMSNASYAIGFNKKKLEKIKLGENSLASEHFAYSLIDVAYDTSKLENMLSIESIVENLYQSNGKTSDYSIKLINELLFGLCALKDENFNDENETRMVLQDRKIDTIYNQIQYRNQAGVITPYIEVPIEYGSIEEIIIGPNIYKDLAKEGLESLLKSQGIKCRIDYTKCSLRQF